MSNKIVNLDETEQFHNQSKSGDLLRWFQLSLSTLIRAVPTHPSFSWTRSPVSQFVEACNILDTGCLKWCVFLIKYKFDFFCLFLCMFFLLFKVVDTYIIIYFHKYEAIHKNPMKAKPVREYYCAVFLLFKWKISNKTFKLRMVFIFFKE